MRVSFESGNTLELWLSGNGAESDQVRTWLEEEILRLSAFQEETLDSIENWTDIIPEADVSSQLAPYRRLQARSAGLEEEKAQKERELQQVQATEKEKRRQLEKQLAETESDLKVIRAQLEQEKLRIGDTILSGIPPPPLLFSGSDSPNYTIPMSQLLPRRRECEDCGKELDYFSSSNKCKDCLNPAERG